MKIFFSLVALLFGSHLYAQLDSLVWENIDRTYLVHLPTGFDGTEELPLIVTMHGGFGSANNIQNQSQLSNKADEEHFIVVYPEGVKGGVLDIRTWNAGVCCGHASDTNIDDVGFINALLDTLISQFPINTNRIYATGMSNGGFMSYRLACELSDRIAAIAPVAASMTLDDCNPNRAVPVISFHSFLDFNIPIEGGMGIGVSNHHSPPQDSVLSVWSQLNSCENINDTISNNDQFLHLRWSDCSCTYENEQYLTRDGGHSWPGGEATLLGDPVSEYINAADLMWEFFERHSLECGISSINETEETAPIGIYPNPTNDILNIKLNESTAEMKISIYSLNGERFQVSTSSPTIDVSQLSHGTYFVVIDIGDKRLLRKFVKLD